MYRLKRYTIQRTRTDDLRELRINNFIISYQIHLKSNCLFTYVNNIPHTAYVFDTDDNLKHFAKTAVLCPDQLPEIIEYPRINRYFEETVVSETVFVKSMRDYLIEVLIYRSFERDNNIIKCSTFGAADGPWRWGWDEDGFYGVHGRGVGWGTSFDKPYDDEF